MGRSGGEPSLGSLRTAFEVNANRERPDRGAETPLFRFKIHPSLPPICPLFGTSLFSISLYREIRSNRLSKTQALMQTRPGLSRKTSRNRVWGLSAPRLTRSRCGDSPISVAGGGGVEPSLGDVCVRIGGRVVCGWEKGGCGVLCFRRLTNPENRRVCRFGQSPIYLFVIPLPYFLPAPY